MSKIKVGINGFGRIGRLALRAAWAWPEMEFVAINDPGADANTLAHLLNFDSIHGRWDREAASEGDTIVIDADHNLLEMQVDEATLAERRAAWKPRVPNYRRGVLGKYAKLVSSASYGAVTDKDLFED